MIAFLIALQISTTHCSPNYIGGMNCTTTTPPPLQQPQLQHGPYVQTDWYGIFKARRDRKRAEAVGKMLANGDCAGAEAYALQKGEMELAQQVREYCGRDAP